MSNISNNVGATADAMSAELFQNRIGCEWLSSTQAAIYLGISENALRIKVCRRQVQFYKIGSRLRFHIVDLKVLLIPEGIKR